MVAARVPAAGSDCGACKFMAPFVLLSSLAVHVACCLVWGFVARLSEPCLTGRRPVRRLSQRVGDPSYAARVGDPSSSLLKKGSDPLQPLVFLALSTIDERV